VGVLPRKLAVNLRTAVGGVSASDTAYRRFRVPFPFRISYLRIEHFIGQSGNLHTYVRAGPAGGSSDKVVYKVAENAPEYYYGDGSVIEFLGLTEEFPDGWFITAQYTNTSSTETYSGCVDATVEEVEVRK
jgi:hypothetical protein